MKHSDLKVGMKVKRVDSFNNDFYTSVKGNISTVKDIMSDYFTVEEDKIGLYSWEAAYFEPVIEKQTKEEVSMNKKYKTRCGYPVRVLCTDMKSATPVLCIIEYKDGTEFVANYTLDGKSNNNFYDLIEVSPWEDFKKDDKVMVKNEDDESWTKAHFYRVDDDKPCCYADGMSSWTHCYEYQAWDYCRKPTKEELGE